MPIPDHLWRCCTTPAIDALAKRFGLPNDPNMQDWAWEVADAARIDEFKAAYESGELSDDERFVLMEMLVQSFDDAAQDEGLDLSGDRFQRLLALIDRNIGLHARTVWYWAGRDAIPVHDRWMGAPYFRALTLKHPEIFGTQS